MVFRLITAVFNHWSSVERDIVRERNYPGNILHSIHYMLMSHDVCTLRIVVP